MQLYVEAYILPIILAYLFKIVYDENYLTLYCLSNCFGFMKVQLLLLLHQLFEGAPQSSGLYLAIPHTEYLLTDRM